MTRSRVERRLGNSLLPVTTHHGTYHDASVSLLQKILPSCFQRMRRFDRIAPTLRMTCKSWRDAIDRSITNMHLTTDTNFSDDRRIATLSRFSGLTDLILEKHVTEEYNDNLDILLHLSQLSSLTLRGLTSNDVQLIAVLSGISGLRSLCLEIPADVIDEGMHMIPRIRGLQSLELCVSGDTTPRLSSDVWRLLTHLTELSLSMQVSGKQMGLEEMLRLVHLRSLKLFVPLSPAEVACLSSMHQLRSLILSCLPSGATNYGELSHLRHLTRLELPLVYRVLPLWIRNLTVLKCLSLSWEISMAPGYLFSEMLSPTLTSLTLHNFSTPIEKEMLAPLTALQKLSLTQQPDDRTGVGEDDSFTDLKSISELSLRVFTDESRPVLPEICHMHHLTSLFIESSNGIKSYYIANIGRELKQLKHLTIGSDLNDVDLISVAQLESLQSLTLVNSSRWSREGFDALRRLRHLTDLCLFHCGLHSATDTILWMIMECLESLEYLGFSPVDTSQETMLPIFYKWKNRVLKIDNKCKLRVYFDGSSKSVTYL